jgi:SAM-dependent methyltransferase
VKTGGYDDGYSTCPCFWGRSPGSLVRYFADQVRAPNGLVVCDLGCGEGKNAAFLAGLGARVYAFDVSQLALRNALAAWRALGGVRWFVADADSFPLPDDRFDLVVAYGLPHCLGGQERVQRLLRRVQAATRLGGHNIVVALNDRYQDLRAHPGFAPCLLPHDWYCAQYRIAGWRLVTATDEDLCETHPHNSIPHVHSMTRILAVRHSDDL